MYEEVTKNIINVGVNDPDITLFENQYDLPEGMAYNSYLIVDDKVCLMDSVDADVTDEWIANIDSALSDAGKSTIDYLVVQHMEPDHSGSILTLVKKFPSVQIYTSMGAQNMMKQFFDEDLSGQTTTIKEGDTLELGSHKLSFIAAPMVHWPEVMMTYESSEKVLFSADGFGKFGVRGAEADDWACEARRYYFNIVGKYGAQVQMLLKKLGGLDIQTICPLHGPVLREELPYFIGLYDTWSKYEPEDKGILIACASIHGNTMKAAEFLRDELVSLGVEKVVLTDVPRADVAEVIEDAFRYDRMVLMSSSYDAGLFPPMETYLYHLVAKQYCNRKVALVQNGTWAPSAAKTMQKILEPLKNIEYVGDVITIKTTMSETNKEELRSLAKLLQ